MKSVSYLSAPPPPRYRQHPPPPRHCWSGARLPQTAGSPPPGCLRGAGRRRSWRRWTSGSWLSPVRQATGSSCHGAGWRGQTMIRKKALTYLVLEVHIHRPVSLPPTTLSRANNSSLSGIKMCDAEWTISSTGVWWLPSTWVLTPIRQFAVPF